MTAPSGSGPELDQWSGLWIGLVLADQGLDHLGRRLVWTPSVVRISRLSAGTGT